MKSFNKRLATQLAYFSQLAYTPRSNINYELTEFDIVHLEDKETDTQGFIAIDDKDLFIVFRGTTNIDDWKTNLNTIFTKWEVAGNLLITHKGFLEAYNSVRNKISRIIADNLDKEVYITGHSLAGSLANLCIVDLELSFNCVNSSLYTYGSPRVFNENTAKFVNNLLKHREYRVVNNNDAVCHLPLELHDYSHTGQLIYIEEDGTIHVDEDLTYWQKKQYALEGYLDDVFELGIDSIKDHFIESYVAYLE